MASKQRGHVARWQLLELGLTRHGCFLSAAALWGWVEDWTGPFEVTVVGDRRPQGIRVHRSRSLDKRDVTRHYGIAVTTPARTALDCALVLKDRQWTRFINEALHSNYLKEAALPSVLTRHPSHKATHRLMPYTEAGQGRTRSQLEDEFVEFIERHGLPMPELNVPLGDRFVDALYREQGVLIELDSFRFHKSRDVFEADREKDVDAKALGLDTIRITDRRMKRGGAREAERLEQILREPRRPGGGLPGPGR